MIILSDDVIRSATLSATSTASGHNVNNIAFDSKALTWRSTAVTSQTITATWDSARTINAAGIAFSNLVAGSAIRVRAYTNPGDAVPVSDSGIQTIAFAYPPPSGFQSNNLASFAYGGGNHYFVQLDQANVRRLDVTLTNPAGIDSFIEISRLVAGNAIEFDSGVTYGAGIGLDDASSTTRTDAGSLISERRPAQRTAEFAFPGLSHNDREKMQTIIRRNGEHTPVFASAFQSSSEDSLLADLTIYGHLQDLDMMRLLGKSQSGMAIKIMEI